MKGPKGIGSFLVFILVASRTIDIIAPNIKEMNIVSNIYLTPKTNPNAAISVTSPPPIPPFDKTIINRKIPPAIRAPNTEYIILKGIVFIK